MIFQRESTTGGRDFVHRIVAGLALAMFANVVVFTAYATAPVLQRLQEGDLYRAAAGLDALHDMRVISMEIDGKAATVTGAFRKRRCDFVRGNYYTRDGSGLLYPAVKFESLVLDAERNRVRPPAPEVQTFGPWRITSAIEHPADLVIYITMACPEGTYTQKLADAPWRNLPAAMPPAANFPEKDDAP